MLLRYKTNSSLSVPDHRKADYALTASEINLSAGIAAGKEIVRGDVFTCCYDNRFNGLVYCI